MPARPGAPEASTSNLDSRSEPDPASSGHRRGFFKPDWRLSQGAAGGWNSTVLAVSLVSVGAAAVAASAIARVGTEWAPIASSGTLWVGMSIAVGYAFIKSRPPGLLRLSPIDLLWGLALGLGLRLGQGLLESLNSTPFPSHASWLGWDAPGGLATDALLSSMVAPTLEEFLFRAVVLISAYRITVRKSGAVFAGLASLLVSGGTFVLLHRVSGSLSLADSLQLLVVATTCGLLILLTGRIWGAVLTHMVYNASYLALVLVGGALGS